MQRVRIHGLEPGRAEQAHQVQAQGGHRLRLRPLLLQVQLCTCLGPPTWVPHATNEQQQQIYQGCQMV